MASKSSEIASLLKNVNAKGDSLLKEGDNEASRKALLEAARNLVAELEPPFEVLAKMNWLEV